MTKTEKTTLIRSESDVKHQIWWADWLSCSKASFHISSIHSTSPCPTVSDSDLTRSKTSFRYSSTEKPACRIVIRDIPSMIELFFSEAVFFRNDGKDSKNQ